MEKMVGLGSAWRQLCNLPRGRRPPAPSLHSCRRTGTSGPCWTLRGPKSRAEQDEVSLQTRISDVSVTPLLGTDPAQGRETRLVVALASANSLVSSQAPDSRRRVRSASKGFKTSTGVLFLNKA